MMRAFLLAGAVLSAAIGTTAHASPIAPSYGYARIGFTDLQLSGVVNPDGTPATNVSNVTSSVSVQNTASYPGAMLAGQTLIGNLITGADPAQATSGPGAFGGQNQFTRQLTPAAAITPSGARSDALLTGAIAAGATLSLVAEDKIAVTPSGPGSQAKASTTAQATFTVTGRQIITLTFNASASLEAMVFGSSESSVASTSLSFAIVDQAGKYATITDNVSGNNSTLVRPDALNSLVSTMDASDPQSFNSGNFAYSYSSLLPAGTYTVMLDA